MIRGRALKIVVDDVRTVSGLLTSPRDAVACCVMAHGAGAGMTHPFMTALADGLAERRVATMRYQFPYIERGSKRPDRPALAQATVRAAVAEAGRRLPALPLIAGGKSFGGRMTSQTQAEAPLTSVQGLMFFAFHSMLRGNRPTFARIISVRSKSRCSSFKVERMPWRIRRFSAAS